MGTDEELLVLAAKAAGYTWDVFGISGFGNWWTGLEYLEDWRPLEDDGDSLRLAVRLDIDITFYAGTVTAREHLATWSCTQQYGKCDKAEVTRSVIFMSAVEIGRRMP